MKLANEFVKFVVNELGLQTLPNNIKFADDSYSAENLTFGTYNKMNDEIVVCKGSRHPVDVLRTLAHELVHHKQREDGKSLDGEDGSDIENEANAMAGTIMRKFRTSRPEIFNYNQPSDTNKMTKIRHVAKTGTPQKIDEQYVDGFTAKLLITTISELSPENRRKFCNESVDRMVAVAYKLVTR